MPRLSEMVNHNFYFSRLEVPIYHGTSSLYLDSFKKHGLKIVKVRGRRDFGTGMYFTTYYWQAYEYARHSSKGDNYPIVIAGFIKLETLRQCDRHLVIDDYNNEWMSTIIRGRFDDDYSFRDEYEWIYGRCGDNITLSINKKYHECGENYKKLIEFLNPGDLTPRHDRPNYEYDQLWIGSSKLLQKITNLHIIGKGVDKIETDKIKQRQKHSIIH